MNEDSLRRFLDRVDRQVVRLGPRDYLAVESLARSRESWSPTELRAAVASVLARSSDQWHRISSVFDQISALDDLSRRRELEGPLKPVIRLLKTLPSDQRQQLLIRISKKKALLSDMLRNAPRLLWSCGIGVAIGLLAAIPGLWFSQPTGSLDSTPVKSEPEIIEFLYGEQDEATLRLLTDLGGDSEPQILTQSPPLGAQVLLGLVVFSVAALLLGIYWIGLSATYRVQQLRSMESVDQRSEEKRRELQKETAAMGLAAVERYHFDVFLPVNRQAVLDSSDLLGRILDEAPGYSLDTEATLDRTIASGGRFDPALESRSLRHDVVVLIDTEEGSHPWLSGFLRLLDAWSAQGISLLRFTFSMTPDWLREVETKQPIRLEVLARQTEDLPIILFSRQLDPMGQRRPSSWVSSITSWSRRAWLDPDPRPRYQLSRSRRRSIGRLEEVLLRFQLTNHGLVLLANHLAGGSAVRKCVPEEARFPELPKSREGSQLMEALQLWAFVAALVPEPSWDQLEAFRRHFEEIKGVLPEPGHLQLLIQWVESETGENAELEGGWGLAIPLQFQDLWLRQQRRKEKNDQRLAGFEARAHNLLLDQLGSTRPSVPIDYQGWRFKRAMHQAMLVPERAVDLLGWLGNSPVRKESLQWLRAELNRRDNGDGEPFSLSDREALARLAGEIGRIPLRSLIPRRVSRLPFYWPLVGIVGVWIAFFLANLLWQKISEDFEKEVKRVSTIQPPIYEVVDKAEWLRVVPTALSPDVGIDDLMSTGGLPVMVDFRAGAFYMGSVASWEEEPVHRVKVGAFQISKGEITVDQYGKCVEAGKCEVPEDLSPLCNWGIVGRAQHPMNCVTWDESVNYAHWLAARLPTEAEWEYAARSQGLDRRFSWGDAEPTCELAILLECGLGTEPVCSRPGGNTAEGLCDMTGNVWEWVEDDWHDNYASAPLDGSAWIETPRAPWRVSRGGAWKSSAEVSRASSRKMMASSRSHEELGFRIARSLAPRP